MVFPLKVMNLAEDMYTAHANEPWMAEFVTEEPVT